MVRHDMSTTPQMSEAEWLGAATVPEKPESSDNAVLLGRMLQFLNDEGSKDLEHMQELRNRIKPLGDAYLSNGLDDCAANERKMKLFGCARFRRIWHALTDERCLRGVEMAEREADGQVAREESRQAAMNVCVAMV